MLVSLSFVVTKRATFFTDYGWGSKPATSSFTSFFFLNLRFLFTRKINKKKRSKTEVDGGQTLVFNNTIQIKEQQKYSLYPRDQGG